MNESVLNDLIGSRICHDLISPLGAIGNGVELLTMSNASAAPEIALISDSIDSANARIRFFRVAFGAASGASIGNSEVRGILRDMYRGSRAHVDWRIDEDLPRTEVKLAFLLIACLESALPWGGYIKAVRTDADGWTLTASDGRQKIDEALWALLTQPDTQAQVTASDVHFALVAPTARRLERRITVAIDPEVTTISF